MIRSRRITHHIAEPTNSRPDDHVSCHLDKPQDNIMLRDDQENCAKKKSAKQNRRSLLSLFFQPMSSHKRQAHRRSSAEEQPSAAGPESKSDTDSYETDLALERTRQKANAPNQVAANQDSSTAPVGSDGQPSQPVKSPLVQEFCLAHRISLTHSHEQPTGWTCSSPEALSLAEPTDTNKDSQLSEQDRRLIKWRLMAARSMWSASSLPSSDSELELLDCQSPAFVVNCSDDTSCSSVELVWTRSQPVGPQTRTTNLAPSVARAEVLDGADNHASVAKTSILQRLSIFDLARPLRARGRRIGAGSANQARADGRSHSINLDRHSSSDVVSPVLWVANPLFSADEVESSATSRESLATSNLQSPSPRSIRSSRPIGMVSSKSLESVSSGFTNATNSSNDDHELAHSKPKKKAHKKRWSSKKDRKPEADDDDDNSRRDNIYLNHLIRFDRRIKSNVASLTSQISEKLSDTSKRASVLADHLIASIKETTKEQLLNPHRLQRNDSLPNSFASLPKAESEAKKAKLFSLIYMHQQQQSTGLPVITRQPTSATANNYMADLILRQVGDAEVRKPKQQPPRPPLPQSYICQHLAKDEPTEQLVESQKDESSLKSYYSCPVGPKLARRRRKRRDSDSSLQRNIQRPAGIESSDDEGFYHEEYAKFRSSLDRWPTSRNRKTKLRSLNYWRRYRMRKLGIEWPPIQASRSHASDVTDLTANYQQTKKEESLKSGFSLGDQRTG